MASVLQGLAKLALYPFQVIGLTEQELQEAPTVMYVCAHRAIAGPAQDPHLSKPRSLSRPRPSTKFPAAPARHAGGMATRSARSRSKAVGPRASYMAALSPVLRRPGSPTGSSAPQARRRARSPPRSSRSATRARRWSRCWARRHGTSCLTIRLAAFATCAGSPPNLASTRAKSCRRSSTRSSRASAASKTARSRRPSRARACTSRLAS